MTISWWSRVNKPHQQRRGDALNMWGSIGLRTCTPRACILCDCGGVCVRLTAACVYTCLLCARALRIIVRNISPPQCLTQRVGGVLFRRGVHTHHAQNDNGTPHASKRLGQFIVCLVRACAHTRKLLLVSALACTNFRTWVIKNIYTIITCTIV